MTFLNTGIGVLAYSAPILLIVLTILVATIEALIINDTSTKLSTRIKKLLIANLISSIAGALFIIFVNVTDYIWIYVNFLIGPLGLDKSYILYKFLITIGVAIPCYISTVIIEFFLLKKILSLEVTIRKVLLANLVSYFILIVLFVMGINYL